MGKQLQNTGTAETKSVFTEKTLKNQLVKFYQLNKDLDAPTKSRTNANIMFQEMFDLVGKNNHLVIINGEMNGGVMFIYGRDKANRYEFADDCKFLIEKILKEETGENYSFRGSNGGIESIKGCLTKIPFNLSIKKVEKIEKPKRLS